MNWKEKIADYILMDDLEGVTAFIESQIIEKLIEEMPDTEVFIKETLHSPGT